MQMLEHSMVYNVSPLCEEDQFTFPDFYTRYVVKFVISSGYTMGEIRVHLFHSTFLTFAFY